MPILPRIAIIGSMEIDLSEEEVSDIADFFKVFGDPTRLKILIALDKAGEMGVNQIAEAASMSQSAISQQLKLLRASRLVKFRKDGRNAIYRLSDDHIHRILSLGITPSTDSLMITYIVFSRSELSIMRR